MLEPQSPAASSQWLHPHVEQEGLQRYVATIRERWWMILLATLLCGGAAAAYVSTAQKVYKAKAEMLVTPVARDDENLFGLGLIRDSNDPTRDVSTAASLVTTVPVADRVRRSLRLDRSPSRLLSKVTAEPLAQSSLISISAEGNTPQQATDLANAFARESVAERTQQMHEQLKRVIPGVQAQVNALSPQERAAGASPLPQRLAALQALQGSPDPTMRLVTAASPPERASSPRPKLSIAAGLFAGLVLGLGGAFGMQALDPRVRREEQLRALFRIPILTRVPRERKTRKQGALAPNQLAPATAEAYRTLRAAVAASRPSEFRSHSILVTGSSPSEGKSTTAINFAYSLVQAGHRVILIEADLRRPTVGIALDVKPRFGIGNVLVGQVSLEEALVTAPAYGQDLQMLLVERPEPGGGDRLALPTARRLISDAEELADYVIVDSPPLTEISDALPLAQQVSDVLVVVRLGRSRVGKLAELGEMLARHDIRPIGLALVGVERPARDGYYYTGGATEGVDQPTTADV